jgi:hypothetical protein
VQFRLPKATEWSLAISLFSEERSKSNEVLQKIAHAKELGISVDSEEDIDDIKAFIALSKEKRSALLNAESNIDDDNTELPLNSPRNESFRSERVKELAQNAPERLAERKERSVQVGLNKVKIEASEYLKEQYTNEDGVMICQICQQELPFKDTKNEYYFEKVEFLKELRGRHYQNYLSLCPNHSAMFTHSNKNKAEVYDVFLSFDDDEFELTLANESAYIYFTKTHICDLKAVLGLNEPSKSSIPNDPDLDFKASEEPKILNSPMSLKIETKGKYLYFLGVELTKEKLNWKKAYLYQDSDLEWCVSAKTKVVAKFESKDVAEYWWSSFNNQRGMKDSVLIMSKPRPKVEKVEKAKKRNLNVSSASNTSYGYSSEKSTCPICGGTGGGGGNCYKCDGSGWA